MNLQRLIEEETQRGYAGNNADAKVCQDIVLKAISQSSLSRNVTIKGGVVMRSRTQNARRATQDLDIDFIKYSLADDAVDSFIRHLNCLDGIKIIRVGKIEPLKQQDYYGKRVYVQIEDTNGYHIKSKIDLGVHNRFELEQEEYCFDIAYDEEGASLLINSNEQIFAEKLRSLLRFGALSTRFKDIFDMYYLKDHVDKQKLTLAMDVYIFNDDKMKEKNNADIVKRLMKTFNDKTYIRTLEKSDKRWIDDDINDVLNGILAFIKSL